MRIAYLIAAHTDPIQLYNLVSALHIKDITTFFIHIDKKVDIHPFKEKLSGFGNVVFIKNRVRTYWGGYSQCRYQINLIEECLGYHDKFDRIFFLSGLDYPLWSNKKILNYLYENPHKELIKGMNLTQCNYPPKMQTRVRLYHFRDIPINSATLRRIIYGVIRETLRIMHINKKNYIDIHGSRVNIYCGSSWWCLSYNCLRYVYNTYKDNNKFESYFKTTLAPDEMMIQTIIFNSEYSNKAILYEGEYPGLVGLTPLHYIEYDTKIHTYSEKDFNKLCNSGKMFFRKCQSGISDNLIELINRYHLTDENS